MPASEQDLGQPSTRRAGRFTDTNHGRRWSAIIDKRSGGVIGKMQPLGWRAPWSPDQAFFRFSEDEPNVFTIDYQAMLDSRLAAHEQWHAEFRSTAHKRGWNPDDAEKLNSLIELIGPKPLPIEPIVAAMQGNSWILGLSQKVDARVESFLPKKVSRVAKALDALDFRDDEAPTVDAIDRYAEYEEDADPQATGGKLQPLPKKPKGKREAA